MKIHFLGTGAGDWLLEKTNNMSEFRMHASVLLDDVLLIDPGPNVLNAMQEQSIDKTKIKYIINTHKHYDHYSENSVKALSDYATFFNICANQTIEIGNYTVIAFKANHGTCDDAVHFIISDGSSRLFYGMDGAWLMYDEVAAIKKQGIDFAVIDGTVGFIDGDYRIFEHNNLNMVLEIAKSLNKYVKQFCINHMAMTLHTDHNTLKNKMSEHNILVAYDGMEIEF